MRVKLSAYCFLDVANLVTSYDSMPCNANLGQEQYNRGLKYGKEAYAVYIGINDVWSAEMRNGGHMQSYERIGGHACTAQLMQGLIDSGTEIYVSRYNAEETEWERYRIQ